MRYISEVDFRKQVTTLMIELNKIYLHDVIKYGVLLLLCVAFFVRFKTVES